MKGSLRELPGIDKVMVALGEEGRCGLPEALVVRVVKEVVEGIRRAVLAGEADAPDPADAMRLVGERLGALASARLRPVINGTGVLIHTNLGRSPLGEAVAERVREVAVSYNNLEFDLEGGGRGKRGRYVEALLAELCEAEAATVVNNCAAALVLGLKYFTSGEKKEVLISRGELVEIGGGFRVPEIMAASGAVLREVGATNKTHLRDYERAIGEGTALILKVHRSNFYLGGFVSEPTTEELVGLARERGLRVMEDLGSGAMVDTAVLAGLDREPTAAEILRRGVDLVCVSGDKLLGGPQAGILAGVAELVAGLKTEPFFRAIRCDKLVFAALEATAEAYLDARRGVGGVLGEGVPDLPLLRMMALGVGEMGGRAEGLAARLRERVAGLEVEVREGSARMGGGTMPTSALGSVALELRVAGLAAQELAARLRGGEPPVVGRIEDGRYLIELRTVMPWQDEVLVGSVAGALG
jgi:L-seryl-tRNA(Ser) seleniumtransferase